MTDIYIYVYKKNIYDLYNILIIKKTIQKYRKQMFQ